VAAWELFYFGKATSGIPTGSLKDGPEVAVQRSHIQRKLKYPAVQLTGTQSAAVGGGFNTAITKYRLAIWACSILPEHIYPQGWMAERSATPTNPFSLHASGVSAHVLALRHSRGR